MTKTKSSSSASYILKLGLILFLICTITAGLLGYVNSITADKIAAITEAKTTAAMEAVMPGATFEEVSFTDDTGLVTAAYKASTGGAVVRVAPTGFGGEIDMIVGIDANGAVSGVSIVSMSETSGLGSNASKDSFRDQFIGGTGTLAVSKDGGTIDALTGATVTSRAVTKGVNAALACAENLG